MYEVINKELGIKSCGLADLTAQQMQHFLGQWEDEATIGTLTLFFDEETGDVVLNKDNKQYEFYLELAEVYLGASEDNRKEFREKVPESVQETVIVLENCLKSRRIEKEIFRAERSYNDDLPLDILKNINDRNVPLMAVVTAFYYGVMQGKRIERARHKKNM